MQNATRGAVEVAASHSFAAASPEARRRRAHMNNCARYNCTEFHTAAAVTNDSLVCPENCMHSACLGFACVDPALSVSHGEFHVFKCSLLVLFSFEAGCDAAADHPTIKFLEL